MFDQKVPITIRILSGSVKECTVRFPTDQEWCERIRRQKVVRRQVTGGKFQTDVLNVEKGDAELLEKIRVDNNGTEFSDAEASKIISRLDACELLEVEREGDLFKVNLLCRKETTTHWMKVPTEDQSRKFSRSCSRPLSSRRLEETTVTLVPSGELYDALKVKVEGYADPENVPITHKDVVVVEVLDQIRKIEEELDPEG